MPSTAIGRIGYDAGARRLTITFVTSGRTYAYEGVPPALADDFRHAFAKGVFFNRRIRGRYPGRLVAGAGDPAPLAPLLRP